VKGLGAIRGCFITTAFQFHAIKKVQGNQKGLELNETNKLLVYDDEINLSGEDIYTIKRITKVLLDASKEVDLEVHVQRIKCIHYIPASCCSITYNKI
jgi:hypothetical protein